METNELMTNENFEETAVEEIETGSNGGTKVAVGVGLGILAGMAICKLAKPIAAKIKGRKKKNQDVVDSEIVEEVFVENDEEESGAESK